ncbi:hypothetical protein [Rothia uropygialis]|uniref:hypothetical protein n=1 Tax=Kocuria sp. 36 TaxID=1415402 RepID=UPI00101D7E0B|nr:hypothetical protein [Kocuria sp. 36]
MNIRSVKVTTASLVSIGMLFGVATPSLAANQISSNSASQSGDQRGSEEGMLKFVDALDKLPEDLKMADPATTPNYEQRVTDELAKQGITLKAGASGSGVNT